MQKKTDSRLYISGRGIIEGLLVLIITSGLAGFLFLLPDINLFIARKTLKNVDYIIEYYRKKNPEKAALFAERATEKYPDNPFYLFEAGDLYLASGDRQKAGKFLKKALNIFWRDHSRYASLLSDPYRETMSRAFMESAGMKLENDSLNEALIYLRYAHDVTPDYKDRILDFTKDNIAIRELSPLDKMQIADFYIKLNKSDLASDILGNTDKTIRNYHLEKARMADRLNEENKAVEFFKKELSLFPDNLNAFLFSKQMNDKVTTATIESLGFGSLMTKENLLHAENVTEHGGNYYFYCITGKVDYEINLTADSSKNLVYIEASGTPAAGIWPVMQVSVNDQKAFLFYVDTVHPMAFEITEALKTGKNLISVRFLNRGVYGAEYIDEGKKKKFREHRSLILRDIWCK